MENGGIKHPDPALQPLIKLNSTCYAIMPHLWLFLRSREESNCAAK